MDGGNIKIWEMFVGVGGEDQIQQNIMENRLFRCCFPHPPPPQSQILNSMCVGGGDENLLGGEVVGDNVGGRGDDFVLS